MMPYQETHNKLFGTFLFPPVRVHNLVSPRYGNSFTGRYLNCGVARCILVKNVFLTTIEIIISMWWVFP